MTYPSLWIHTCKCCMMYMEQSNKDSAAGSGVSRIILPSGWKNQLPNLPCHILFLSRTLLSNYPHLSLSSQPKVHHKVHRGGKFASATTQPHQIFNHSLYSILPLQGMSKGVKSRALIVAFVGPLASYLKQKFHKIEGCEKVNSKSIHVTLQFQEMREDSSQKNITLQIR